MSIGPNRPSRRPLRVVLCPPELNMLASVMKGEVADATYIIQAYIAEGLQARGHRLTFLGPHYPEAAVLCGELEALKPARRTWTESRLFQLASKAVWRMQRITGIPYLNVFQNLRLFDATVQLLRGNDLLYERNGMYKFGAAMACKRLGIPYILYVEADDILEHDIMKQPIVGLLRLQASRAFRYNLDAADRVICVSEPLKAHLAKHWSVPTEKIVVFSNVADVERFQPSPEARIAVRAALDIGDAPLILFVGNFYEWHDVATLLRAFVLVVKRRPDARLLLVGDGARRGAMVELSRELDLEESVVFAGMAPHAEVPRFMAAADVAVVPYPALEQDVWLSPLKLFEYLAAGNAVVASNVGQLSEWIDAGRSGLLVAPGDASALADAIERLIADPDLRSRLGQNARADAVEKHSWKRYLSDLEELFYSCTEIGAIH